MSLIVKHSENFISLSQRLGYTNPPKKIHSASGGCIHNSQIWVFDDGQQFFIKQNRAEAQDVLQSEFLALTVIYQTKTIRCPKPMFFDVFPELGAILAMEYLDLESLRMDSARTLGKNLAALHHQNAESYGFPKNNFIGATPQKNATNDNWADFFWNNRIQYQLHLASKNGYSFHAIPRLRSAIYQVLKDRKPSHSLLHGDLWGGNAAALSDNTPVVFDPASYYGDPETDIAFTEVFGGFPDAFYDAYRDHADWDESGYKRRKDIYNLYHYLNHLNLFGSGYYSTSARIIEKTIQQYG